ncbi:uncharacterized protein FA14DRAFT_184804 [Meira miltonrushii]|uniref:Heme haloperoxidase family profile domain-containing protein n=1 Tax=Meira miltonrushii TaxID=1280837 RepID=A0A316VEL9_9BASI|nr:uncharacterized protein FA14DRAFT_184804 [Meira miltonrushii]PWN35970.1 hypothetical protein FA14DRAFT_184804 [Meira miltonrushii]
MKFLTLVAGFSAAFAAVSAQSSNQSICDKYTTALLKDNNATNQKTVLTLVVNTALIGTYSNATGAPKNNVTGILNNGTYGGQPVSLLKFFDGSLKSTNRNGNPTAVNFLDGGGAEPLKMNMPANDSSSNQYTLVTHLYEFFGTLLGCSDQTQNGPFMTYQGVQSMSQVHRFMNLDETEMNYFIEQVGMSATSFGVSDADAMTVGNSLNKTFNYRCAPPVVLGPGFANVSQSTCLAADCMVYSPPDCNQMGDSYPNGTNNAQPQSAAASGSSSGSSGSGGSGMSGKDGSSSLIVNFVGALALAAAGAIAVSL